MKNSMFETKYVCARYELALKFFVSLSLRVDKQELKARNSITQNSNQDAWNIFVYFWSIANCSGLGWPFRLDSTNFSIPCYSDFFHQQRPKNRPLNMTFFWIQSEKKNLKFCKLSETDTY